MQVGSWICGFLIFRLCATTFCYVISVMIIFKKNHLFKNGKRSYILGHSLLLVFDTINMGVFFYFVTNFISLFTGTLKPEALGGDLVFQDGEPFFCDKGLYVSSLVGFLILCVTGLMTIGGLAFHILHNGIILNRYRRGE